MFELPQAKRIHRQELYSQSRSASSSPNPEAQKLFLDRFSEHYDSKVTLPHSTTDHIEQQQDIGDESEEEALEFRLFAAPTQSASTVAKIRVASPKSEDLEPGIVRARPKSYYFHEAPSPQQQSHLDAVALTGDQVIEMSKRPWIGCKLPWRVTIIPTTGSNRTDWKEVSPDLERSTRKHRKGKKARIAIRKRLARDLEKKKIEMVAAQDQDLADRMKKSKKNRDKKLRQREKEKMKKAGLRAEDTNAG